MAGEGQVLLKAREAKGWSLDQAEEATKIRVRYLQALEEENYAILPGNAYVKGFLRTYAKNLNLNPEEILNLYRASAASEAAPVLEAPLTPIRPKSLWLRPLVAVTMGLIAIALVIGIASWSRMQATPQNTAYEPPALPAAPPESKATPNNQANPPASASQSPETVTPPAAQGLSAKLVFTEDVWIVVKVDGQPSLQGTFPAGTTKELQAKDKIELVNVGNAGGLMITLNGQALPKLGKSGQVVRNIALSKDNVIKAQ